MPRLHRRPPAYGDAEGRSARLDRRVAPRRCQRRPLLPAVASGLDSLTVGEKRGHLPTFAGAVAEAVAVRIMDAPGFSVFAQQAELCARGADLIYLTPQDNAHVLEAKGTLRAGTIPRLLPRSRLKQMSVF